MIGKIRKKIKKKFEDEDFSEIVKKSASGFFISVVGRNFGFAQQLLITNFFGAAAFGVFRVCFSILSLVGIFGRFGVDMAVSRFVAQYRKQNRPDLVNEIFQLGIKMVFPIALVLSLSVFFLAPWLSENVYQKPYTFYIQIFSFGIFFLIISSVVEESIRGLKKITTYSWINKASTQGFSIVILLGALVFSSQNDYIVNISYVIGLFLTLLLAAFYWFKYMPFKKVAVKTITVKSLLAVSVPLLMAKELTTLYTWLGTLILAAFVSDTDVGVFNGAARLSAFATMPLIAVNNINGPRFAEAFGENDNASIRKTVKVSTRLIFWSCMPIMLAFFLFPKFLMGIYGEEFTTNDAITAFIIINLGQVVNFATGPVTQLLNMTGRQNITLYYAGGSTIISIVLSFLFIPSMGMIGAALATGIGRTFLNLGCSVHIYFTLGINTIYNPVSDLIGIMKRRKQRSEKKEQKRLNKLNKRTEDKQDTDE